MTLSARFAASMDRLWAGGTGLGVAVSGGGDSMAMLHLMADWARPKGVKLYAVTVDHRLRRDSANEAALVERVAGDLGVDHATLSWDDWDGHGNLQDAARRARHGLFDAWRGDVSQVALGHTMDDQAETVLMNLARGSGVEGLSGMAARMMLSDPPRMTTPPQRFHGWPPAAEVPSQGYELIRPLLHIHREELRAWLRGLGATWVEDPSNDDDRFRRVQARKALAALTPFGLGAEELAATAARMARARDALEAHAADAADRLTRIEAGDLVFDLAGFRALERETQMRLLAAAIVWVANAHYRPRAIPLEEVLDQALDGVTGSLGGCLVSANASGFRVSREPAAVLQLRAPAGETSLWDNRWRISGPAANGHQIGALGEAGLASIRDLPEGLPRSTLIASPAIWDGDRLVAAPIAAYGPHLTVEFLPRCGDFVTSLVH